MAQNFSKFLTEFNSASTIWMQREALKTKASLQTVITLYLNPYFSLSKFHHEIMNLRT